METKIENITNINGVILTQNCLEQLHDFQKNDNAGLKNEILTISHAISYVSKRLNGRTPVKSNPDDDAVLISDLAFLQDFLENLGKPS